MTEEYYLYTFESTHGAIATEKLLKALGCTVMPVPRHISTSCGISVRVAVDKFGSSKEIFPSVAPICHLMNTMCITSPMTNLTEYTASNLSRLCYSHAKGLG